MMDDHTPPGGASEEQALRGLLHGAVEGLEPSEGALERLRCAVPARRALKRQVCVGAAAVALLAGTAIPAALHLTAAEGSATDHSAMAGHGEPGGKPAAVPSDPHLNGAGAQPRATRSVGAAHDAGGATGQPDPTAGGVPSGGVTQGPGGVGPDPVAGTGPQPPTAVPGAPGCGADQLGVVGSARAPRADGKVYGSFKVTNVSAHGCTVTGAGTVRAAAAAGTSTGAGAGVSVVGHTAGDPASGLLPDPSAEAPVLVLQPNTAYEVQFAFVPSGEPCPAPSQVTGTKPPAQSGDTAGASGIAADTPEPRTDTTAPAAAGVAVSHTPQAGSPTTQTTIPEACTGTVYRTGAIPVDAPKP
ncbi:hypothetical protein OG429_20985 [Streptomyces sp. NBC_00190]|uniref:hypothetical protein n=1 Tax=unclassified Streptomyces TaxID=2593676 RepID=UPI002E2A26A2|nr:hypothetical protein [Streptomyces sp. NBC_00190]WSZ41536.1 hypothetical protein OG239_23765 [Streptomyces sp. NBC_00868]